MSNSKRPNFSINLSVQEFERHYWYKKELIEICHINNISSFGTKAELENRIKKSLNGEKISDNRITNTCIRKKQQLTEISLSTRLIPDGYKFNQKARELFAKYYNQQKFSFTKEMPLALREANVMGIMK